MINPDQNNPNFWKWDLIYYNPNDKSVLVKKRIGFGWTFNYARPASMWITVGILLVPFIIAYFTI